MKISITPVPVLEITDAWLMSLSTGTFPRAAIHTESNDPAEIKSAILSALAEYDSTYDLALQTATAVLRHAVDVAKRDGRSMDAQVLADANLIIASLIDEENERIAGDVLAKVQGKDGE